MSITQVELEVEDLDLLDRDELMAGTTLGHWRVTHELGRGGMGIVYAVVHEIIGKRAALKVMHKRLCGTNPERLMLEARVVNEIDHPNIVDIFEVGKLCDDRPYLVMERLDGVALSRRLTEIKILPDRAVQILLQVAAAVAAAHAAGVIHRDLKPENVFLVRDHHAPDAPIVKVLDWGIAKVLASNVRHTCEGFLVGSPHYVSPEQVRGLAASEKSDVYSLGVMAHELLLEALPFEGSTNVEIMVKHLHEAPTCPSELWPAIPYSLEDLLLEMLAKDPDRRPTMVEVAQRLEAIASVLRPDRTRVATEEPRGVGAHRLVEDHLRSHAAIADVAIISDHDHVTSALVVCATGQRVGEAELLAYCRSVFPERLCPKRITVLSPSTSSPRLMNAR